MNVFCFEDPMEVVSALLNVLWYAEMELDDEQG